MQKINTRYIYIYLPSTCCGILPSKKIWKIHLGVVPKTGRRAGKKLAIAFQCSSMAGGRGGSANSQKEQPENDGLERADEIPFFWGWAQCLKANC